MSMKFEISLDGEDAERLFALKEEWRKKDLTGNEFAEELLRRYIRKLYPEQVRHNEYGERILRNEAEPKNNVRTLRSQLCGEGGEMENNSTQETLNRDEFQKKIRDEIQSLWGIELDEDGDFHAEIHADYRDEIASDDIKKICLDKLPEIAFGRWIEKRFDNSKESVRQDVLHKLRDHLEEEIGDVLSEEQEIWLSDYIRQRITFKLPEEQFLNQKVLADVFVNTGDSAVSFTLNSRYLSEAENPSNGRLKPSIVWLAETQGYSEEQLTAELNAAGPDEYDPDGAADKEGFLKELRHLEFPMFASPLVFLAELTVRDVIRINAQLHERDAQCPAKEWDKLESYPDYGMIHIPRETSSLLFDPWFTGAGTAEPLKLEKDIDLPLKYVHSALPDGAEGKYNVRNVYAMQESAWRDVTVDISGDGLAERLPIASLNEMVKSWESDPLNAAKGRWWAWDEGADTYVAVDNSTGDAWTEEFDTPEQCILWLKDPKLEKKDVEEMSVNEQQEAVGPAQVARNSMKLKR